MRDGQRQAHAIVAGLKRDVHHQCGRTLRERSGYGRPSQSLAIS
jgi:hypothetical protein